MGHTYTAKSLDSTGKISWTYQENHTWSKLITRQRLTIQNRACPEFLVGLDMIGFSDDGIPEHQEINMRLSQLTGWKVQAVPALIPDSTFHTLLSNQNFPAASFIRIPEELDYLEEPDIFHEFFGHIPLLTNKKYSEFLKKFGILALSLPPELGIYLTRIFWFTVEFGLIQTQGGLRVYGAGILSSHKETLRSLEDPKVDRIAFNILECARTPYRYDIVQSRYFIIEDFEQLYAIFDGNLLETLKKASELGDIIG